MKFRPTALWRMRISPGPGSPTCDVDELHFFGAAMRGRCGRLCSCHRCSSGVVESRRACCHESLACSARSRPVPLQSTLAMQQRLTPATALLLTMPPLLWAGNAVVGRLVHDAGAADHAELPALGPGLRAAAAAGRRACCAPRQPAVGRTGGATPCSACWASGCYNALQYLALKTSTPLNVTLVGGQHCRSGCWRSARCSSASA